MSKILRIALETGMLHCQIRLVRQRCLAALPGRFLPRLRAGHFGVSALFLFGGELVRGKQEFEVRQQRCHDPGQDLLEVRKA